MVCCYILLSDRQICCLFYIETVKGWFSSKRSKCFGFVGPFSARILFAGHMLMESSVLSIAFLLLTQLVTFKVP